VAELLTVTFFSILAAGFLVGIVSASPAWAVAP
jgi:hypothetical protein